MRLTTFDAGDGPQAGLLVGERVHPVAGLLGEAPIVDVQALLELPYDALAALRAATPHGPGLASAGLRLLPPVLRPPNIRDHIAFEEHASRTFTRELPDVWRRRPLHYYSNTSCLYGSGATIPRPTTQRLDYELELAAVIARPASNVRAEDALDTVAGFMIMNDWTARDLQFDEMAYGLGPSKGKDFATSFGPWLVTTDELLPYLRDGRLHLDCRVTVNGEQWADTNAGAMYHSWGQLIEHASLDSRLLPGDVIASGTVGGGSIGEAIRKGLPARYLLAADVVSLEVAGLGILTNTVGAEPTRPLPSGYLPPTQPPMPLPLT
jgi:fumarylacetoacetate (FAA) hydrolase